MSDERLRQDMANLQDVEHDNCIFDLFGEKGDLDKYNSLRPLLHMSNDIYDDGVEHPCLEIDTPLLITKDPKAPDKNKGQKVFKRTVEDFLADASKQSLVVRSRYGSGKTTFMQRLIQDHNPAKVLYNMPADAGQGHDEELQAFGV